MLLLNKYKIVLFVFGVTSLAVCTLTICIGALEIYSEMRQHLDYEDILANFSYHLIALVIFVSANTLIFGNILYFFAYALKGSEYIWYVSCNYLLYILSEIASVIVVLTRFSKLNYPVGMAVLVAVQAVSVLLFFVTCAAQAVFTQVQLDTIELEDIRRYKRLISVYRRRRSVVRRGHCYTISLYPKGVNTGAGISKKFSDSSIFSGISVTPSVQRGRKNKRPNLL